MSNVKGLTNTSAVEYSGAMSAVPYGWENLTLGDIFLKFSSGMTPSRSRPDYFEGNNLWITSGELNYNCITNTKEKITDEAVKATNLKIYPKGTFFIAITGLEAAGTRGRCAVLGENATVNQSCMAFEPNDKIDTNFLFQYYMMHGEAFAFKYSQGTKQQSFNASIVKILPFLLPPLPEQQKIAAILTSVDKVIEKTQAQIDKLKDLKTGMMQELLTKGIGHTEFKGSPVGRIPADWEIKELEQLVNKEKNITYGIVQAGPHCEGGIPYIRVSDMNSRHLSRKNMLLTSPVIAEKFKRSAVSTGDIVYALRGMIGHVQIVPSQLDGANLTQGTARISPCGSINSNYLLWAMKSPYVASQNDLEAKGSTFKEVTLASLRKMKVCVPTLNEQDKIVSVLNGIDEKIFAVEDKLAQIVSIKKALMQDLLTGKVRVNVS